MNHPTMGQPLRKARAMEAKKRFEAGEKAVALADEYKVTISTVYRWVWCGQKNPRGRPRKAHVRIVEPSGSGMVQQSIRSNANSVFQLGGM